jgi:poly-gamma-glutamate biosynthesis protein PgsC/CapC
MTPEVAVLGISLGLFFSLICYLITNLSPGGMITPGWLAVILVEDATRMAMIVGVVVVTYFVMRGVQRIVILYGKRLFAAVVLLGVFLQITLFLFLLNDYPLLFARETLGFIVPGLIAYQLIRQPIIPTLLATSTITALAYGVMLSGVLLRFIPAV